MRLGSGARPGAFAGTKRHEVPGSVGDVQFLQASSWMRFHLLWYAEVTAHYKRYRATNVGNFTYEAFGVEKTLIGTHWTDERLEVCEGMLDLLQDAVRLAHVNPRFQGLMIPDGSDLFGGSCVTQVPRR